MLSFKKIVRRFFVLVFISSSCVFAILQWNWDANEVFHFMFESINVGKIFIDVNPDGSGFLEYHIYDGTTGYWRNLRIEWTAAGTGEWWEYDEAGNVIAHGTWI